MKVLLILLFLFLCVIVNLFLPFYVHLPTWYSFAAHFFIAGTLLAYFTAKFWIWFNWRSFWDAKPFFRMLGILSGDALGGVLWEIFEYWYSQGNAALMNDSWFYKDTIWDFQMNFLGALIVAFYYFFKKPIY